MIDKDFYAEGNNGADNIQIKILDDERLRLKVGHCLVYTIDAIVPVEFVTAALTEVVLDAGGVEEFLLGLNWGKDYIKHLISKVSS